jgi:hypothetical protein
MIKIKTIVPFMAMMLVLTLAACSNGADEAAQKKSNLPQNDIIGSLPSILLDYDYAEEAAKERLEKQREKGDAEDYNKLEAKEDKARGEREAKFNADRGAEWAKALGKDIPFSTSEAFDKLNLEVKSVKIAGDFQYFTPVVFAKEDIKVSAYNDSKMQYGYLAFNFLAKDGSKIADGATMLIPVGIGYDNGMEKSFKAGEEIPITKSGNWLNLSRNTEQWADFASIQFVTDAERMGTNK